KYASEVLLVALTRGNFADPRTGKNVGLHWETRLSLLLQASRDILQRTIDHPDPKQINERIDELKKFVLPLYVLYQEPPLVFSTERKRFGFEEAVRENKINHPRKSAIVGTLARRLVDLQ